MTELVVVAPEVRSWIDLPSHSDFPIQNLPYGVFARGEGPPRIGVAIGESIVDLYALAQAGFFEGVCDRALLTAPSLEGFLAAGRATWSAVRRLLVELLRIGGDARVRENAAAFIMPQQSATMCLPTRIGDYVDFYSSLEHATNMGKMLRPAGEALLPNWRWIPIGYHGRSSTIVVDGTPIVRPNGQRKAADADAPAFGPTRLLDIELEMGFFTGPPNEMGEPIALSQAREHIFGLVLVNDWSARDIQAWEYQPLGPFLGKSFATTISPWIVTLDALEPYRVAGPRQEPPPLDYLRQHEAWNYDVSLAIDIESAEMRERGIAPYTIVRSNFKQMYWSMAQQLAHVTSNGTNTRPGDLYASGTISGEERDAAGSFMELTWRGAHPLVLPTGETRAFLEDGDDITLRGFCERPGSPRIGFGYARGRIEPAHAVPAATQR